MCLPAGKEISCVRGVQTFAKADFFVYVGHVDSVFSQFSDKCAVRDRSAGAKEETPTGVYRNMAAVWLCFLGPGPRVSRVAGLV